MTAADRIPCIVPFCRRTADRAKFEAKHGGDVEIICGKHWRMIPKRIRRRRQLAEKLLKRAHQRADREAMRNHGYISTWRLNQVGSVRKIEASLWERCKSEAINAAVGI